MVLAENYPELKANQNFMDLSSQLSGTEGEIANSRKYYNAVVRDMNNKVQMVPSNIIACWFGFKEMKMFETDDAERQNVNVEF
jgi:LemA protein